MKAKLTDLAVDRLTPPAKEQSRDRVLDDRELVTVWEAAGRLPYPWGAFVRLAALTGQRLNEIANMRRTDLHGDLWFIPNPKNSTLRRIIILPLAAHAVLKECPKLEGPFMFSTTGGSKPIRPGSNLKTERDPRRAPRKGEKPAPWAPGRLDQALAELHAEDPKRWPLPAPWRLSDLRRTCASGMARLGVAPHVIERLLNHRSGQIKGLARVYKRPDYAEEVAQALHLWADHVGGFAHSVLWRRTYMARVWSQVEIARRALKELRTLGVPPRLTKHFNLEYLPDSGQAHLGVDGFDDNKLTYRQRKLCYLVGAALDLARVKQKRMAHLLPDIQERAMQQTYDELVEGVFGRADREREHMAQIASRERRVGNNTGRKQARMLYSNHLDNPTGPHMPAADFVRVVLEPLMRANPERFWLKRNLKLEPILPERQTITDWIRKIQPQTLHRGRGRPKKLA